ncbi:MAG TPA: hypothetical protein VNZ86_11910 [Bacteroidia bacterium]|nr:hypothetical protein [Bacteroidia bacterium]
MKKSIIVLTTIVSKKIQVVLHLHPKSVAQLIVDTKSYIAGISANAGYFPTPNPAIATVQAEMANLESTAVAAEGRAKGTVAARNAARKTLELALKALAFYVEGIANNDPDHSLAIAKAANMTIKTHTSHQKQDFSVVATKKPGELLLTAKSEKGRVTFLFELSTDISNPANWKTVQASSQAKALIRGLVSGTKYYGRVTMTDKTGQRQIGTVLSAIPL